MKIYVIYDSYGNVWDRVYTSFESALVVVSISVSEENRRWSVVDNAEGYQIPASMQKDFTKTDEQGGVFVAFSEIEKTSTYIKQLIL
jgi:hypothetical protein